MVLFWTIFPALMVSVIFGHTFSPELLANFEQYLVDEYRDKNTAGSISNVDEYLGGDDLRKKVADFANNFRHSNYASTNENIGRAKRETPAGYYGALLDSSSFILNGFQDNTGVIPINFPTDMCLFEVNSKLYAAALSRPSEHITNQTFLSVFQNDGTLDSMNFREIYTYKTKSAQAMDCIGMGNTAFIALAYMVHNEGGPIVIVSEGSPVFQVQCRDNSDETVIKVVQYFTELHLNRVYLIKHVQDLYFVQSFCTDITKDDPNTNTNCLIYKWSGYHFDVLDELPCTNAMQVEPFHVGSDLFVAIANYRDAIGQVDTYSYIYKFSVEHSKFVVSQKLRSHAAVDLKYFELAESGKTERFLVLANSYIQKTVNENGTASVGGSDSETHSIIYKYTNDFFMPFQSILLYDVEQFLPVLGPRGEFLLMTVCTNQAAKVWQYNGWNFEESPVQFTGGALAKGVSHLRHYPLSNGTAIVVANTNMMKESNNIYLPIYSVRKNAGFVSTDRDWCAEASDELFSQTPEAILNDLQNSPKKSDERVHSKNALNFQKIKGQTLTTAAIKTKKITIDQSLIDRLSAASETVQKLNDRLDAVQLNKPYDEHRATQNMAGDAHLEDSKIFHIPVDQHSRTQPAKSQSHTGHTIQAEQEVKHFGELIIDELVVENINNCPVKNLVYADRPISGRNLKVQNLFVKHRSQVKKPTSQKNDLVSSESKRDVEQIVYPDVVEDLTIEQLIVDGSINGIDLATIQKFALRVEMGQQQQLDAQFHFGKLNANNVIVRPAVVSRKQLTNIIRTVGGPYTVLQDVSFAQLLMVNNLVVHENINNIISTNGKLDVLLKRSSEVQRISGYKRFNAVTLRSPIVMQGKISHSNLERMNPVVTVDKDIVLDGDYVISGNVTIREALKCTNLFGASSTFHVKYLMDQGLKVEASDVTTSLDFTLPIQTRALIASTVNDISPNDWARVGSIQEVTGRKTFISDLHIAEGFCDALTINGVQFSRLNETVLQKTGDQTIEGNIQFKKITVKQHSSQSELLNEKRFTDYLSNKDQIFWGNVTVRGNLLVRNAIQIANMQSAARFDGFNVLSMIEDTLMLQSPAAQTLSMDTMFSTNVSFGQVSIDGNLLGLGKWTDLQHNLASVQQNINLVGPMSFGNAFRVDELVVRDAINGIRSEVFGKQWMLRETDQNFTAAQYISSLSAEQVWTQNSINNLDLVELFQSAVWSNESLAFDSVAFGTFISNASIVVNGPVNGLTFPDDIIQKKSFKRQELIGKQVVKDLQINGRLDVSLAINGINWQRMSDLFDVTPTQFGLHVLGSAEFMSEPACNLLNEFNLTDLKLAAWYLNEKTILGEHIVFDQTTVNKNIELLGYLNGKNITYLNENYVSLSRPQEVIANLTVTGNVMFKDVAEAGQMNLVDGGVIRHSLSASILNVNDFCVNMLLKDVEQEITGKWSFFDVIVHDEINALINDLDFRSDILRFSISMANVTAIKYFRDMYVEELMMDVEGRIQDVLIADWMVRAILTVGNYTIQGTTVLENPFIFGDVHVFGTVNNILFTPETILLKSADQEIQGHIRIQNKRLSENKIQSLTINEAELTMINGVPVNQFFQNLVNLNDANKTTYSHLIFVEPVAVGLFHSRGDWNGLSLGSFVDQLSQSMNHSTYTNRLGFYHTVGVALANDVKNRQRHLESLRFCQSIEGNIRQIAFLRYVSISNAPKQVYVMYDQYKHFGIIHFYKWDSKESQMELTNDQLNFELPNNALVDMTVVSLFDKDYLIVETTDTILNKLSYFTYVNEQMRNIFESFHNESQNIVSVQFMDRSCVGLFTEYVSRYLQLQCALFTDDGHLQMEFIRTLEAPAKLVQVVSFSDGKHTEILMLDVQGGISVWQLRNQQFMLTQQITTLQISRTISTTRYKNAQWLATSSEFRQNSTHLGSVDIYRSTPDGRYEHIQSILVDIPAQIEIVTINGSGELALYMLTENRIRPFIVFKYTGVTLFREFFVATTLPLGRRFRMIGPTRHTDHGSTELIGVIGTKGNVNIIETVLN